MRGHLCVDLDACSMMRKEATVTDFYVLDWGGRECLGVRTSCPLGQERQRAHKGTSWFFLTCLWSQVGNLAVGNIWSFVPLYELLGSKIVTDYEVHNVKGDRYCPAESLT